MKACFMGLGYIGLPTAIVVPTPFTGDHQPDISYVERPARVTRQVYRHPGDAGA